MLEPEDLGKSDLLNLLADAAKNWLAHDGLWFQAVEIKFGMETAIALDGMAWQEFTQIEAQRIMRRLKIKPGGGIPALIQALKFRLYAYINKQTVLESSEKHCILRMDCCRVQEARKRKNLPDFPCKPVGILEYTHFAKTIDPRIDTRCLACPPDPHPREYYCSWEFRIK
jgi:hypothetical protein